MQYGYQDHAPCRTCNKLIAWGELYRHQVACRELRDTRAGMENGAWARLLEAAARHKASQNIA